MSFGAVADDYNRLRPPPPDDAVDWLLPGNAQAVVDLAAGTGLLTRALARQVPRVVAVEPDERMAAVLRAHTGGGIEVLPGRGEAIPLPDASADGVFVSSAWQWMDPQLAATEIGRVLRDGARFGLIWTGRDREVDWVRQLDALRQPHRDPDQARHGSRFGRFPTGLPEGLFGRAQTTSFTFTRTMTASDTVAMLATYSGLITADPQDVERALDQARTALDGLFPGADEIDVPMRSLCWRTDRTPRP